MKELTKEAARRANSSMSPSSCHAPIQPPSSATAPDILSHQTLRQPPTKPSLFHPSNVQFSSTPMKAVTKTQRSDDDDDLLESLLLDGKNDLPISGHHLSSSGCSSTNQIHRFSPIHDLSGLKVDSPAKWDVEKKVRVVEEPTGNGIVKLELEEFPGGKPSFLQEGGRESGIVEERNEIVRNGRGSPCSCRSLNTSLVSIPPPQAECINGSFSGSSVAPLRGIPSSGADSHRLFAETKARMENARTNIRHFLHSEKTRTSSDMSFASQGTSVHHDVGRMVNSREGFEGKSELNVFDNVVEKVRLLASSTETVTVGLGTGMTGTAGTRPDLCDPGCSPRNPENSRPSTDVVVMETASSGCCQNASSGKQDQVKCCETSGGRSWAEILDQSSTSNKRNGGQGIMLPDLSWNEDSDVITAEMLYALKAKVEELKRRQERLEQDHFFAMQDPPPETLAATKPDEVLTSVFELPGNSQGSSSGVSVSERSDAEAEKTAGRNAEVDKTVGNHVQSSQNTFHRTSSVARCLMSQFAEDAAAVSSESRQSAVLEASTGTMDVTFPATNAGSSHNAHNGLTSSASSCHNGVPSGSQHPIASSSSSHRHEVMLGGSTGASDGPVGDVLETRVNARTSLVDRSGQVVSSGVPLASMPYSLHSFVSHDNLGPNSGSANANTGMSVQPVSMFGSSAVVMNMGNTQNVVGNPGIVSCGRVVGAVNGCSSLSSECFETLPVMQLPVKTAAGTDGCSEAVVDSEATAGGLLLPNHLDSLKTLDDAVKSAPEVDGIDSQSADCRHIASVIACVSGGAAVPLQQPPVDDTLAAGDMDNFIHISSSSEALPAAAPHSRDTIQQPAERRLSQSVHRSFKYLLVYIISLRGNLYGCLTVLSRCWLGGRNGIRPVKTEWWGAGVVICLE